jgi:uncharacterized membrane protein YcaP (DUF421 family)
VTEGVLVVLTIVFWDLLLDWLAYHYKFFAWLVRPAPLPLMRQGELIRRHLRQEMISVDELRAEARNQGIADLKDVSSAHLEANGDISFIKSDREAPRNRPSRKPAG